MAGFPQHKTVAWLRPRGQSEGYARWGEATPGDANFDTFTKCFCQLVTEADGLHPGSSNPARTASDTGSYLAWTPDVLTGVNSSEVSHALNAGEYFYISAGRATAGSGGSEYYNSEDSTGYAAGRITIHPRPSAMDSEARAR